jgi:anti-sigma B factor antagonist
VQIERHVTPDGSTLALVGELDTSTTPRLIREIDAIAADDVRIVLDLSAMTFMDSSGLGAILYAWTTATQRNGRLVLVCPLDAHLRRTLDARGVGNVLSVVETRAEALAAD